VGEKMKNLKLLCEIMSENPKCHMHIPQSKKNIYVLKHHHPKHLREKTK
jgi:hypothetical protein